MMRDIKGELTVVTYHYYPEPRPKLFVLAYGKVMMSYAGKVATNAYKRLEDGYDKRVQRRAAERA